MASVGNLSLTLGADARGFINEFDRAENAARRKSAAIDKQLSGLEKSMKSKFGAGQITGSILSGLGIGTGFQIAEKAAELIAAHWREAAESAKKIEESSKRAADAMEERMRARRTDDQQLTILRQRLAAMDRTLFADDSRLREAERLNTGGRGDAGRRRQLLAGSMTAEAREQLRAEREELLLEITKLEQTVASASMQAVERELTTFFASIESGADRTAKAIDTALRDFFYTLDNPPDMERINAELEFFFGQVEAGAARNMEAVDTALRDFFYTIDNPPSVEKTWTPYQQQMFAIFDSVGDRAASTFADMVIDGENAFSSLVDVAARAMLEMAARMAVINPILNAVFGLTGTNALPTLDFGKIFGGGKAGGGMVSSGTSYLVGEEGPEMFTPRTSGSIIPNHRLAGAVTGESITIINNVQAGVSRAELIPALNATSEATIARIRDMDRRRK